MPLFCQSSQHHISVLRLLEAADDALHERCGEVFDLTPLKKIKTSIPQTPSGSRAVGRMDGDDRDTLDDPRCCRMGTSPESRVNLGSCMAPL